MNIKQAHKSIVFIHMLNNFSGSPNVLSTIAEELYNLGVKTTIVTSFNNDGFLSKILSSKKTNITYSFKKSIFLRLLQLVKFQLLSALEVIKMKSNEIVYINTILPFLPALVAHLRKIKVVYHIHEAYPKKGIFQNLCFWCAEKSAYKIFCVSEYVKNNLSESAQKKSIVIYNSLSKNFLDSLDLKKEHSTPQLLMISSAREYKGIFEFCKLAKELPSYNFKLVCDGTEQEIKKIFKTNDLCINNSKIYSTQKNLHPFYAESDLILNLSNPNLIIETFGLTILEGMCYGLPAIIPPIGGITELVNEGENGYKVNVNDFEKLKNTIITILENKELYNTMSKNALLKSKTFSLKNQIAKIENELFN